MIKKIVLFLSLISLLSCHKNNQESESMFSKNWTKENQIKLSNLISKNAHQKKIAIFDFDNTTFCRDIGEATMAQLESDSMIFFSEQLKALSPVLSNDSAHSVSEYYETMLHLDAENHANAYLWAAQSMAGLKVSDVVLATQKVMEKSVAAGNENAIQPMTIGHYPIPYIYAEMTELYAALLFNEIEPYIVSASNIWSVRYAVLRYLNPEIQKKNGNEAKIKPGNIFGINFWLRDTRNNQLFKDEYLVATNALYAEMDMTELSNFEITNLPVLPVTAYGGKVALIKEQLGNSIPVLVAGDSPNDFLMMHLGENQLWLARMEKPDYLKAFFEKFTNKENYLVQPVLNSQNSGFYTDVVTLLKSASNHKSLAKIKESINLLE